MRIAITKELVQVELLGENFSLEEVPLLAACQLLQVNMCEKDVVQGASRLTAHLLFLLLLSYQQVDLVECLEQAQHQLNETSVVVA